MKSRQTVESFFLLIFICFISLDGFSQKMAEKPDNAIQKAVLTDNIRTLLVKTLEIPCEKMNTDWFGTIQVEALLLWAKKGYPQGTEYVEKWLSYHIEHDNNMSDEEYLKSYEGPKARIDRHGVLPFSIYAGNLGVAFPCYTLYKQTKNKNAKNVCLSVADAILHYSARDKFGFMAHDDNEYYKFAIPDVGYFSVRGMADASELVDEKTAQVFLKNAVFQARTSITLFFDKEKKLTRTIYLEGKEPGKTYWCRASGWMIYTLTGLLRHLPKNHPDYRYFTDIYKQIADGLVTYQGPNGGLRVWVNEPDSPEEVTGTSMTAGCIQEAMDKQWIPENYNDYVRKAWKFINSCVTVDGKVVNAYTGWAVPSEQKLLKMDERYMGFVPGMVLVAAAQIIK
ncbi:MAG TPA: glycoside hydrolase family 88 protein [Bacteroidales bacterium]|nr:glycoside hydrolase family 88 protein [Bacteroidales bacterium]